MSRTGLKDDLSEATRAATRLYAALAAGDAAALDEQHGPHAMRDQVWWQIGRAFDVRPEPSEFHLLDDGRLYVAGRYCGEGRVSGLPLDAAFVHAPSAAHPEIITRLLETGVPTYVDKPLAYRLADSDRLVRLAESALAANWALLDGVSA